MLGMLVGTLPKDLIVRKTFRYAGKEYTVGQPFPWFQLSCSRRKALLMIQSGHLRKPGPQAVASGPQAGQKPPADPQGPQGPQDAAQADPGPQGAPGPQEDPLPLYYDPATDELVRLDRSEGLVKRDGVVIARIKGSVLTRFAKRSTPVMITEEHLYE